MRRRAPSRLTMIHSLWVFAALCIFFTSAGADAQSNSPEPRRIVVKYALTSTHDLSYYDPRDWRLQGSTNGGQTWTTLDTQTNQFFGKRNQRRSFEITNRTAFSVYRLRIDRINAESNDPNPEAWQAQLAELELIGPVAGVADAADMGMLITSSWSHPLIGPPENAFDNDLSTRWLDFGLGLPGGCWIQCQYVFRSELSLLVTNISQLAIRSRLAAAHDLLLERGPRILSKLSAHDGKPRWLTSYALTSANDVPARDPCEWRLLGSDDDGNTWNVVDARSGEKFATRFERRVFTLAAASKYAIYRLEIDRVGNGAGQAVQIGEIEPNYADTDGASLYSLVVSATTDNPPAESCDKAFDGDPKTKWLSFAIPTAENPCWIQWQCIPMEAGLPVIDLRRLNPLMGPATQSRQLLSKLTAPTNARVRAITGYALTTALDAPARDPKVWRLLGSNNEGRTWDTLDARTNEIFGARGQRRIFPLANTARYALYRLVIDCVADPHLANAMQIAKIEPLFDRREPRGSYRTMVSAAGENGSRESAVRAFDGNAATKWLDRAHTNANRATWIQWSYSAGLDSSNPGQRVFDLDQLQAEAAGRQLASVRPVKVSLEGVAVSWDAKENTLGLLDGTGFQMFQVDASPGKIEPGQWVHLDGLIRFGQELPEVVNGRLTGASSIPRVGAVGAEQHFEENQQFLLGTAAGVVTAISQGPFYTTIRLIGDDGKSGLRIKILNPGNAPFVALTGRRLEARGVVEPVFDDKGQRVAGTIWVARPMDANLAPLTENEWSRPKVASVAEVSGTNVHLPSFARVRGRMARQNPDGSFVLSDGTNQLIVQGNAMTALASGSMVEAAGFLSPEGKTSVLHFACVRPAGAEPAIASVGAAKPPEFDSQHPITDIRQVNDLIRNWPRKNFPVKLRGVITYIDLSLSSFYLQDGSNGIPVEGSLRAGLYPLLGQEGMYIELQGMVKDGSLHCTAPVTVLGRGRIPEPLQHSWDYLMTGRDDGLWVQVQGVVTAFEKQRLTLTLPGGQVIVWINQIDKDIQNRLLGSVVRVSGICAPVVNSRNQRLGLRLLVPSGEYVELVTTLPDNPFDLPVVPIGKVMQLNSDDGGLVGQLVKTKGIVTYKGPNLLFLQDGDDGIRVSFRTPPTVEVGDQVEAVGLPQPDGFSPKLTKALLRKVTHLSLPAPKRLPLSGANQDDALSGMDATRGQLDAVFLGVSASESLQILQFRTDQTEKTFSAFLPLNGEVMRSISPGSRVRLEGVFKAKVDNAPDFGQVITSFEMYLNSPSDLTVLERPPWWTMKHTIGVLGGLGLVLLVALAWAGALQRKVAQRTRELSEEIEQRERTGVQLKAEIVERKRVQAEADKAQGELLVAARQAGMAEVAIGVLHNVGNVLNSVNVSSALVADRLRQLKFGGLSKAVGLMQRNQDHLAEFLSTDDKGRHLLPYLAKLGGHLEAGQSGALQELDHLCRNVEHIKDIITVQQSYATHVGLTEPLQVVDLVEDALRMNASSLERHDVRIIREYDPNPPKVNADKHKIVQILVNVVRNALQACEDSGRSDKQVVIRVSNGEGSIKVSAVDNGVGILPENISRIFNHGFTTRKNGHGFGLHSSALAAKEMGGVLRFSSPGPGQGATFTLELPLASKIR